MCHLLLFLRMCHLLLLLSPPLRSSLLDVVIAFISHLTVTLLWLSDSILCEAASYRDAILHPESQHAMAEEIAALEQTRTWDLVPYPPRVRSITCKWVYKVKTRSDGSLECYKACLVARAFQQEQGRDYVETFAPVSHMTTIRTLYVVSSVR
jgi:hypothetical protein